MSGGSLLRGIGFVASSCHFLMGRLSFLDISSHILAKHHRCGESVLLLCHRCQSYINIMFMYLTLTRYTPLHVLLYSSVCNHRRLLKEYKISMAEKVQKLLMTSYTLPHLVKVWIFIRHRQIIFITILVFQGVKSKVPPGCNQWPAMRRLQSSSQRSHHSCYHFTQTSLLFHHHQHNHSNFSINYHTQYQYIFRCTTFPIHWLTLDFRIFTNFQWEWVKFPEKSGNERSRISAGDFRVESGKLFTNLSNFKGN